MSQAQLVDVYERKDFADRLVDIVTTKIKSQFSIGIDATWGNGKTTFIENYLTPAAKSKELPIVVFDCFEQERSGDPFITITQHILQTLSAPDNAQIEEAQRRVVFTAKKVFSAAGTIVLKALSRTILKQETSEVLDAILPGEQAEIISTEATAALESFISDKLKNGLQEKIAKENFREAILELAKVSSKHGKILVVIDELDRCRPDFALDVLESIKHILNAEGLVFVIAYHKTQMHSLIKHEFGADFDAVQYLHKFINLDLQLPVTKISENADHFKFLVKQFFNPYSIHSNTLSSFSDVLNAIHFFYGFEARTIERICTTFALCDGGNLDIRIKVLLVVWSVKHTDLFRLIVNGKTLPKEAQSELNFINISTALRFENQIGAMDPYSPAMYFDSLFTGMNGNNQGALYRLFNYARLINQYR